MPKPDMSHYVLEAVSVIAWVPLWLRWARNGLFFVWGGHWWDDLHLKLHLDQQAASLMVVGMLWLSVFWGLSMSRPYHLPPCYLNVAEFGNATVHCFSSFNASADVRNFVIKSHDERQDLYYFQHCITEIGLSRNKKVQCWERWRCGDTFQNRRCNRRNTSS